MELARVKTDAAVLYLKDRDINNRDVVEGAQTLSEMRGNTYPVVGKYTHAQCGPVVVLDTRENGEVTLPEELVELGWRPFKCQTA